MTVFEFDGRLLVVDCGVLFPDVDQPGVDLILPDFTSILRPARTTSRRSCSPTGTRTTSARCRTCCAHKPDIPLVGSQFTLALIEAKLAERRIEPYTLTVAEGRGRAARPVPAASSSRSTTRSRTRWPSRSRTPAGTVLHTGDFKMDQLPLDGRLTDLAGFARLGARGRRPAAVRLDQRRDPRLRHPGTRDRAGTRQHLRARPPAGSSSPSLRLPRAPRPAGPRRAPPSTAARSRSSAGPWCATWASPATSASCASPAAWWSAWTRSTTLPPEQIVLMSTGSQGEPMCALGRGWPRATTGTITDRARRHRRARLLAGTRQRDRRVTG